MHEYGLKSVKPKLRAAIKGKMSFPKLRMSMWMGMQELQSTAALNTL